MCPRVRLRVLGRLPRAPVRAVAHVSVRSLAVPTPARMFSVRVRGDFGEILADDRWQGYPEQRGELLDFIVANEIEGILWLTGDFHMSTASRVDTPGGVAEEMWEVMVGTGGSFLNIAADLVEPMEQFPVIFAQWCTCLLHLDPGLGVVRVEWVGDDGIVLEAFEISL